MFTLAYQGCYMNGIAYFAIIHSSSRSRRVRVLLPGAQYIRQFQNIVAHRGLAIQFQDVDPDWRF